MSHHLRQLGYYFQPQYHQDELDLPPIGSEEIDQHVAVVDDHLLMTPKQKKLYEKQQKEIKKEEAALEKQRKKEEERERKRIEKERKALIAKEKKAAKSKGKQLVMNKISLINELAHEKTNNLGFGSGLTQTSL